VLCVGTGGLGSPLALYLAAAGVGTLGLVDFDVVDYTNLQRQMLHHTSDVGRLKLDSAIDKLKAINPFVEIKRFDTYLNSQNALEIFEGFDIIADGTDNFATRYLVNDACVLSGKPNVYASIFRFEGQASIFAAKDGPCYRCLYPEPPPPGLVPSCAEGRRAGRAAGIARRYPGHGSHQADPGRGRAADRPPGAGGRAGHALPRVRVRKNPECPVCGANPTVKELIDYNQFCGVRGEDAAIRRAQRFPRFSPRSSSAVSMPAKTSSFSMCANRMSTRYATSAGT
jgi:molybdopterin/thiamine biosynthesis adenylyltransferase